MIPNPPPPKIITSSVASSSSSSASSRRTSPITHTHPSPAFSTGRDSPANSPLRHALTRPLSPDLPIRDALYLFANFSSYMRSPDEGAEGIKTSEDFRDTVRLLDYARSLSAQAYSNVHVLHLKYRYQPMAERFNPYIDGEGGLPPANAAKRGVKSGNPVPQPFSTLHDQVVKIDYMDNGVFEPLPAQAIFSHIAQNCQPPPRIIIVSYVCSRATQNHLASISAWALTSSPPAYVFSPLKTRLREQRPLHVALQHAIPMSMYAWPPCESPSPLAMSPRTSRSISPITEKQISSRRELRRGDISPVVRNRQRSVESNISHSQAQSQPERQYPSDPVATLTITNEMDCDSRKSSTDSSDVPPPVDRIPLWALAPGVGVLHGSTSNSIGIQLADFSASNLVANQRDTGKNGSKTVSTLAAGIKTSSMDLNQLTLPPPVEPLTRPATPAIKVPLITQPRVTQDTHLTPPEALPLRHTAASWPAPVSRVPGWRKGRKEQMEDTLEELGMGSGGSGGLMEDMVERVRQIGLGDQVELELDEEVEEVGCLGDVGAERDTRAGLVYSCTSEANAHD